MIKHRVWLTDEQRTEIARRYAAGEQPEAIAASLGVCGNNIRNALRKAGAVIRDRVQARRRFSHNEHAFDVLTPESEYWIGFLFSDGSIIHYQMGSPAMTVTLAERDREHLVKLRAFLGSDHTIYERISGNCRIDGHYVGPHPQCSLHLRSRPLAETLMRHGMHNKSLERTASPELAASRHFWRGLVDGDGYVNKTSFPRIGLCGGATLIDQFIQFTRSHGIGENAHAQERTKLRVIGFTKTAAAKLVRILYEDADTALARKNERAQEIIRGAR